MHFLTISVTASFAVCLAFAVVVVVCNCRGIEISDTLIQWFFTMFGVEFAATAAIKISKHTIRKQEIKEKIENIKREGLTVDKKDLDQKSGYEYGDYDDYDDGSLMG